MKEIKGKSTLVQVIAWVRVIGSQQNVLKEFYKRANMGKNKTCLQDTNCTILYEHILNEETVMFLVP